MHSLLAVVPQPADNSWIPAVITGGAVVIAALISVLLTQRRSVRKTRPVPNVTPSRLSEYSGPQNAFTKLVMDDNIAIRSEMAAMKTDFDAKLRAVITRQQVIGDGFVALSNAFERARIKPILEAGEQEKINAARAAIASDFDWPTFTPTEPTPTN